MMREETIEYIKVMQAYVDGKKIQMRIRTNEEWRDCDDIPPVWNWGSKDYRIAPEPKYRPFSTADEAFQEAKKHGFWVIDETGNYRQICYIYDKGAEIANEILQSYTYDDILSFAWADTKTPCGILEE